MRAWLLTICCPLLCLVGCRTLQPDPTASLAGEGTPLSQQETAFAEALAHYGQGLLYEGDEGRHSTNAMIQFRAAATADPGNHDLLSRVAVIALHQKNPSKAVEALEESYRHDPKSYERSVDLAAVYHAAGRHADAIDQYNRALKLDRTRAAVYVALAGLHFYTNADKLALRTLDRGHKHAARADLILLYIYEQGKRFVAHGEPSRAIPCFERLAKWDIERRPQLYQVLAELYLSIKDEEGAIDVLTRATKLPNPLPEAFVSLAVIHLRRDKEIGFEILETARDRLKDDPSVLFALGCLHSDHGDYERAIPLFDAARSNATESASAETADKPLLTEAFYLYHGAAYERTGRLQEAEAIFEECLVYYPQCHNILNYLAYMWAESDQKLDKALEYVERALAIVPDSAAYRDTLGWIYYRQGRHEEALKEIQKANALMEGDSEILHHLGDIYNALGNRKQAISHWKASYMQDPENADLAEKLTREGVDLDAVTPPPLEQQ
jgi:tetratricopeptide (TPR) repeat protein